MSVVFPHNRHTSIFLVKLFGIYENLHYLCIVILKTIFLP
jgi:hypothetical protein